MFGPPELVHVDMTDTATPGIVFRQVGKGSIAWIPWNLGGLYYRLSLPAPAGLFRDVVDRLNPDRQLRTNAHPLIEMTLMKQEGRHLLHLINVSGHSQTGYYPPFAIKDIHVQVAGGFKSAKTIRSPHSLPVHVADDYSEFTIPELADYELVVLQ
jgi:hypothetical protein